MTTKMLSQAAKKKWDPCKNSQAVKTGVALKSLGEKSCESKGGGQEMITEIALLCQPLVEFECSYPHFYLLHSVLMTKSYFHEHTSFIS